MRLDTGQLLFKQSWSGEFRIWTQLSTRSLVKAMRPIGVSEPVTQVLHRHHFACKSEAIFGIGR